jgi:hypothetical protein
MLHGPRGGLPVAAIPRLSAGVITAEVGNAAEIAGWGPDVIVSGSAIFDGRSPARNLELLTQALEHPVACPIEEVAHGKR